MSGEVFFWIKLIHILSATMLFGTGIGTALHMWLTHLRGDVAAIASTARNVVLVDWLFTATSGFVQPLSGALLIWLGGHDPLAPWLIPVYPLYLVAAFCWFVVVWIQLQVREVAVKAAEAGSPLPQRYFQLMRWWFILGWPAFLSLVTIFWLMVMRPM